MSNNILGQLFNHNDNINQTDKYLHENIEIKRQIDNFLWAYHEIGDVVPQYIGKLGSGHFFPFSESLFELNCSFQLTRLAFYKHAFIALKNAFELGLLMIYWDRNDNSERIIKNWYKSRANTPFKRDIIGGILNIENVNQFNEQFDLKNKIDEIYGQLSDYVHTKGTEFSSMILNQGNFTRFNSKSLDNYYDHLKRIVHLLLTLFILKYPVAIQNTPIEEKFGINGPFGGFLDTHQSSFIKSLIDPIQLEKLQEISNNDENAILLKNWVNSHNDISEQELKRQLDDFNDFIKNQPKNEENTE